MPVDQGTFTPFVFSCFGGMSRECSLLYSRLTELLAEKRNENLSKVKNWMRTRLNFNLLRSCLLCLRWSRSIYKETILDVDEIDNSLVVEESRLIHSID